MTELKQWGFLVHKEFFTLHNNYKIQTGKVGNIIGLFGFQNRVKYEIGLVDWWNAINGETDPEREDRHRREKKENKYRKEIENA